MRRIEGSKNVEKMKRSRSQYTEITRMWHLNVIVCLNSLYFSLFVCALSLFSMSNKQVQMQEMLLKL